MIRVEVKNFQSIAQETVEISGFSVVVGRSNIGKSALVRAVKAALTGAPADHYVRHSVDCQRAVKGAKTCKCFCSVRIVAEGFDLLWEKGDAVNRYVFNGTEHTVVGRGTPEFLGAALAPVYIGGDSTPTLLQVADQFRPLFILDRSGTAVADVLSDVAKLDEINDAARAAEKDRRECASARKLREKDLKELDRKLDAYEGLEEVVARVRAVEDMGAAVTALEARLATLVRLVGALEQCTSALRALQPIERLDVPPVRPLVEQAQTLRALSRWHDQLRVKSVAIAQFEGLAAVLIPDLGGLQRVADCLRALVRWAGQLGAIKVSFVSLKAAEAAVVPAPTALTVLLARVTALSAWSARFSTLEAGISKIHSSLAQAEQEESAVLAQFKELEVCPTCRQPVRAMQHTHHLGAA
jgi:hypothetical protein